MFYKYLAQNLNFPLVGVHIFQYLSREDMADHFSFFNVEFRYIVYVNYF